MKFKLKYGHVILPTRISVGISVAISVALILISSNVLAYEELNYNWVRSEVYAGGEELVEYTTMSYDSKGKRVSEKVFSEDGKVDGEVRYSYNSKGQIIKIEGTNKRGKLEESTVVSYNSAGLKEKQEIFNGKGKLQEQEIFEYTSKGLLRGISILNAKGKKEEDFKVSSYDGKRPQQLDAREAGSSEIAISLVYQYNSKGMLTTAGVFPAGQINGQPFVLIKYLYK
ncbi:MAG: hypothetical protein K0U41_01945 [Gammaproteobacteria bacterium]|nr:hypothetical protein [Gammaproteobacteria bacterium]